MHPYYVVCLECPSRIWKAELEIFVLNILLLLLEHYSPL
jgi:hypothetical protein